MLLFDAAIPGDIERAVGGLEGAFLYDLNDLENLVMEMILLFRFHQMQFNMKI